MTTPIWDKPNIEVDARIMGFLAAEDVVLDRLLLPFDIEASQAHVNGLARIGVLSDAERGQLVTTLAELRAAFDAGQFDLDQRFEDGHSAIEWYLTEKLGSVGAKVHTGRSRNDQVLVASRLYMRARLNSLARLCHDVADVCLTRAAENADVVMPGYTHLQRAVVSTLGLWFAANAEAFVDNLALALSTHDWIDSNPLGSAAGFGVNLPLDRVGASKELGFGRLQVNSLYAQTSRGKFELQALTALGQALGDVRRLSWDLSLFATQEFGFVRLPARYTTGSSIMPNKRNPDLIELLRAEFARTQGACTELVTLLALPAGYHRDLQNTKGPLLRAFEHGLSGLALLPDLLASVKFDADAMSNAIEPSMFATDEATRLAAAGVPFRDAYRQVAATIATMEHTDAAASIAQRNSPGGPGQLELGMIRTRLKKLAERLAG